MSDVDLKPNPDEDVTLENTETISTDSISRDVHLSRDFVVAVQDAVKAGDAYSVHELLDELHAADMADLIEALSGWYRKQLLVILGTTLDPEVLVELEESVQRDVYDAIPNEQIADAVSDMDTDDAVFVLEDMHSDDQQEILGALKANDRAAIEEGLSYPEDSAGRLMQRELVALPAFWNVGQAIDFMRDAKEDIADIFYEVFVVDPSYKPVGTMPLSRLLRATRPTLLSDIMQDQQLLINASDDQEDVAYNFTKYHLISAAVVNAAGRLVGMITVDDVVDVIEDEVEEDIMALAGVHVSGVNENFVATTKNRFVWLFVNMLTAAIASYVITIFEGSIEQMVALAVLMPIVASMGGNAGTQTMTVAVRALATKELNTNNAMRILYRESAAAFINGVVLAILAGALAWAWFDNMLLGGVFAAAIIFNILVAGISGLLVPLFLDKLNIDPAVASSVFVTTITDVVGFFAFLGLAAIILL